MVEPVVLLLNGRGHPIVRAREAGIEAEDDQTLVEYALARGLVIVTFDRDLCNKVIRGNCRCLHVRTPEKTARQRLADGYSQIVALFDQGCALVTLVSDGSVSSWAR
jgi:hypothetical protein